MNDNKHQQSVRPHAVKKAQYRNLTVASLIIIALFGGTYWLLEAKNDPGTSISKTQEVRFTDAIGEQQVYNASIEQFQSQMANNEKTAQQLKNQIKALQEKAIADKTDKDLAQKYQTVLTKLSSVETQLDRFKANAASQSNATQKFKLLDTINNQNFPTIPGGPNLAYNDQSLSLPTVASDGDDRLQLVAYKHKRFLFAAMNPNTYVPAGTHVLGVLLQGADLVADNYDQQNPKPILIRLVSSGALPNHRHSHLKNCVITAAMTGDISSGRGDVRLERLSCVRPNNSIIDVAVFGTVSTNAKEGISGQIYTREGKRLFDAGISGVAAGVANGVSQGYVQYQNSVFGPVGHVDNADLLKYGAAQGAATGLNKLSDFEMGRVDQIHPIIQVNGGRLVTVTFLKGFFFDGKRPTNAELSNNPWAKSTPKSAELTSAEIVNNLLRGDDNDEQQNA